MNTDTIDRLYCELAHVTRAFSYRDVALMEEVRRLRLLVHESANRFETIRETHPQIETSDLIDRLRVAVPDTTLAYGPVWPLP